MIWWDFHNDSFLTLFITIVVLVVILTAVIIIFTASNNNFLTRQKKLITSASTVRVYIIDLNNNTAIYFNRSNIKLKRKMTLSQFYMRFDENDVDKLKNWIYSICIENHIGSDYLEVDMVAKKNRTNYYSVLKMIKFDPKVGLLHLESHLMQYIVPHNSKMIKNIKGVPVGLVNKEQMKDIVEKQKSLTGYTYCVRFFYKKSQVLTQTKLEKVMVASLKNVIYGFCKSGHRYRQIIDEDSNEIVLFDITLNDKEKALKFAVNISHELQKTISIKGYGEVVNFAIGIVENAQYYQDFNAIYKTSQQACIYAQQHGVRTYLYSRSSKLVLSETGKYSQEISRLLKPNVLQYFYRAIIDANVGKVIGYFSYISAPESPFGNFMEMSKYSAKVHRNKEFFAYVSKNLINRFDNEKQNKDDRLFVVASLSDISFIYETVMQITAIKTTKLVLVFVERDFDEEDVDVSSVYHLFDSLRKQGVELGLIMYDQNLLLVPEIYSNFDYFILGGQMVKEIKKSKYTRLSIHSLAEQLLKYKKKIIASDIDSWQAIELIVNSGITYLSSEVISPRSPMVLPVDKRKMDKIVTLADTYQ